MKKLLNNKLIKNYLIILIFTNLLEISFRLISQSKVFDVSLLRIFIGLNIISLLISFILSWTNKKSIKIFNIIIAFIFSIYAFLQLGFNNFIGVPRSLLDLDMNAQFAVIEMGMSARGEIEYLTSLAEPDIAVVTNVYPMHIEFLGTLENIARAKAEIFSGLRKGGIAIYNEDTSYAELLRAEAHRFTDKVFAYGMQNHPQVALHLEDEAEHCFYNAWCVLKVAEVLGLDIQKASLAVNQFSAPEGRGKKHKLDIDGKHVVLIDDSYSGQPEAMKLAIRALAQMKVSGKRVALLGKMAELGDYSKQAHIEVGQELAQAHIDVVIGICSETKDMLAQLPSDVQQFYFPNIEGVADFLKDEILDEGDVLLIKGAHYSSQVFNVAQELLQYQK